MAKQKIKKPDPAPVSEVDISNQNWVTDGAWISGLVGALSVLLCAYLFNITHVLETGIKLGGFQITDERTDTLLAALLCISFNMVSAEFIRLWFRSTDHSLSFSPKYRADGISAVFQESLVIYIKTLVLFWLVICFYQLANTYGFQQHRDYYQPWFRALDIFWYAYLWLGLPYVLLTRCFKHDELADKKDLSTLITQSLNNIGALFPWSKETFTWSEDHKNAVRALLVKMFFAPLMTVFFCDQFPHLVSNIGYLGNSFIESIANGTYTHRNFNGDLFNISVTFIFSIDVALAWCGYVVSSRWVNNQTVSAEPTLLGWLVCICCYPPFQFYLGLYYGAPSEKEVLTFDNLWLTSVLTSLMVASYVLYMTATLWFGVRFSNLTHRGVIRKGPFALVRHPAYASKNFAWWCVMFPVILYNSTNNLKIAAMQIVGLCLMTGVYYMRAITEEQHLSRDPMYIDYCKQVKYRFIPGLI